MSISQKYIDDLPLIPIDAAKNICADGLRICRRSPNPSMDKFKELIPLYSILLEIKTKLPDAIKVPDISFSDDVDRNLKLLLTYFSNYKNQVELENAKRIMSEEINSIDSIRENFRAHLGEEFAYSFTAGEIEQIQNKINTLRKFLTDCQSIAEDHKNRLLRRLEKLQSELHKKMSNVDRFWGLIGDAGITLGKFGKDTRPLVENIKEIANIVWRAQTRSEGIEFKPFGKLLQDSDTPGKHLKLDSK